MKKKDILILIEYQKNLLESTIGIQQERFGNKDILKNPLKGLYHDIKDLEEEFAIISKEFTAIKEKRNKNLEYIKNNKNEVKKIKCSHPIIFEYKYGIGCTTQCAVCGKESVYNQNAVYLTRYDEDIENCSGVGYNYYVLNSNKEIIEEYQRLYNLIHGLLINKKEDEEIDFTKLFNDSHEKYNIGLVNVEKSKKDQKEILVITGSNNIKINNDIYIINQNYDDERIIEYLRTLDNCRIKIINRNYNTIDELKELLQNESNNKIDLVIDFSKLFDYKVEDGIIKTYDVSIDLKDYFPNSDIITIKNIEDELKLIEELNKILIKEENTKKKVLQKK